MKFVVFTFLSLSILIHPLGACAEDSAPVSESPNISTVAEVINVQNYVYLRLQESEAWIATVPMDVAVGDRISFSGGAEMRDFYSSALERSFASITFVQSAKVVERDIDTLHQNAVETGAASHTTISVPETVSAPSDGEIEPLPGGVTIAALLADPVAYEGRKIRLRAKVTKVNANIQGKNWITLQDGTGPKSAAKLLATTAETAVAGNVVIASGVIRRGVDIGAGYKYDILLEDAVLSE